MTNFQQNTTETPLKTLITTIENLTTIVQVVLWFITIISSSNICNPICTFCRWNMLIRFLLCVRDTWNVLSVLTLVMMAVQKKNAVWTSTIVTRKESAKPHFWDRRNYYLPGVHFHFKQNVVDMIHTYILTIFIQCFQFCLY